MLPVSIRNNFYKLPSIAFYSLRSPIAKNMSVTSDFRFLKCEITLVMAQLLSVILFIIIIIIIITIIYHYCYFHLCTLAS